MFDTGSGVIISFNKAKMNRDNKGRFASKGNKLAWSAVVLVFIMVGIVIYNESRTEYIAMPAPVVEEITNEQKLTNHLAEVMQGQTASREVTQRAMVALEESLANDAEWDIEVEKAITNIKVYQGIE